MKPNLQILALTALVTLSALSSSARAQAFSDADKARSAYSKATARPRESCESMAHYQRTELREIHAKQIAATQSAPAFCQVTGVLAPEIAFEVALPARWNGRFYMIGNGGLAGESLEDRMRVAQRDVALKNGFAFAQTNTGHDARREPSGSSFSIIPRRPSTMPIVPST